MSENIELTSKELEEIKDETKFRTSTHIYLKQLSKDFKDHCESSQEFRDDVTSLKTHRAVHWFLISAILLSILWFKFV